MNKKYIFSLFSIMLVSLVLAIPTFAECVKIQSGSLRDVNNNVITTGNDKYGYNYQAHMFNGLYENFSRPAAPVTEGAINLEMKWSDDWLANRDCSGDSKLDRGLNAQTLIQTGTSMGWLTNHISGDCLTPDGDSIHATYFVKIIYVGTEPSSNDPWAGKRIWGVYAIVEEVGDDPSGGTCTGQKGLNRSSLVNPAGLGINYSN